jgi:hypothetical protein
MGHTDSKSHYISNNPEAHRKIYAEGYQFLRIYEPITETAIIIQNQQREIETLKEQVKEVMQFKDRLVEMENQLYKAQSSFEEDREDFLREIGLAERKEKTRKKS